MTWLHCPEKSLLFDEAENVPKLLADVYEQLLQLLASYRRIGQPRQLPVKESMEGALQIRKHMDEPCGFVRT